MVTSSSVLVTSHPPWWIKTFLNPPLCGNKLRLGLGLGLGLGLNYLTFNKCILLLRVFRLAWFPWLCKSRLVKIGILSKGFINSWEYFFNNFLKLRGKDSFLNNISLVGLKFKDIVCIYRYIHMYMIILDSRLGFFGGIYFCFTYLLNFD